MTYEMDGATALAKGHYRNSDATRVKIIEASLRIIADVGIAGASLRKIAARAGQANTNTVKYHFGGKPDLVRAIFVHYSEKFEDYREVMLHEATRNRSEADTEALLKILLLPYLSVVDEHGRHIYANFIWQYMTNSRPSGAAYPLGEDDFSAKTLKTVLSQLYRNLAHLPSDLARPRVQLSVLSFAGALMRWDSESEDVKRSVNFEQVVADAIGFVVSGILSRGPVI